ncbi:MAG: hypothetical protein GEV03_29220 [Streptosporangiales bacterium]|nr:hypothetical protein [Streptosporangiales bacterium]
MSHPRRMDRRVFLASVGVLGAAGAAGILPRLAFAGPGDEALGPVLRTLRPVLDELSRDTINGLVVFAAPGPDPYSKAQGTPRPEPGGIEARGPDFVINALNNYLPVPDQLVRPVVAALKTGFEDLDLPLPSGLADLPTDQIESLDDALSVLLENDQAIPLSLVVALLLNFLAARVNPAAVNGAFVSPFARLSYREKARVFQLIEGPDSDLVEMLDRDMPEPLRNSVSGLLKFVGGALIEFATFGSYCEWGALDQKTKILQSRPVGYELTGYIPNGHVEGWDDFRGYYQGRRKVEG